MKIIRKIVLNHRKAMQKLQEIKESTRKPVTNIRKRYNTLHSHRTNIGKRIEKRRASESADEEHTNTLQTSYKTMSKPYKITRRPTNQ